MGVITVVLTAALVCFTLLPLLAVRIQGYQQVLSVYEVQVGTIYTAQEDALPTGPLDDQFLTDTLNQGGYPVTGTASGCLYLLRQEDLKRRDRDLPLLAVSLSSYNQLRALSRLPPLSLAADQYGVAWSNTTHASTIDGFQQTAPVLTAGGSRLHKAPALDCQDSVGISLFTSQTEAVYILPDAACQGLTMATTFYAANTAQPLSYSFAQSFDQIAAAHQQSLGRFAPENLYVRLHTLQANEGVSNLLLLSLVGTYAGGILMISCLTLLAVQQLTDARQQQRRFQTAIHLGMAAEDRDQVIRRQMLFWFGLPVAAAVLCSLGVLVFSSGSTTRILPLTCPCPACSFSPRWPMAAFFFCCSATLPPHIICSGGPWPPRDVQRPQGEALGALPFPHRVFFVQIGDFLILSLETPGILVSSITKECFL